MSVTAYPLPPQDYADWRQWGRLIVRAIFGIMQGRTNNVVEVTLTENAASTAVTDARIGVNTALIPVPVTANAAAEIGAGTMYVSNTNRVNGSATITHANNSQTDRTFKFILVG